MNSQMTRVISSPSSSTMGFFTSILAKGLLLLVGARQSATIRSRVFGGGSFQLARVFGVRIGVDPSWFFVLFLLIWQLSSYYGDLFPGHDVKSFTLAVASALLFFLCVLLHEMGHAVVAMRGGIAIAGIDLFMFGGVAKMERDTETPGEEFRVAVAGPVVTLLIALVCFGVGTLISSAHDVVSAVLFETGAFPAATAVLGYLTAVNVVLLVFN